MCSEGDCFDSCSFCGDSFVHSEKKSGIRGKVMKCQTALAGSGVILEL